MVLSLFSSSSSDKTSTASSESIIIINLEISFAENIFKKFLRSSSSNSEMIIAEVSISILSITYFESTELNSDNNSVISM